MIFKNSKNLEMESEYAKGFVSQTHNDWNNLISNHSKEIEEINALKDNEREEIIQKIIRIVSSHIPESDPTSIVRGGIFVFDSSPYHEYLKDFSKKTLRSSSDNVINTNIDKYTNFMNDFLNGKNINTTFGSYFFKINKINLETEHTDAYKVSQNHETSLNALTVAHSDGSIKKVNEDVVGLSELSNEIKGEYNSILSSLETNDINAAYQEEAEEYYATSHSACIQRISEALSS